MWMGYVVFMCSGCGRFLIAKAEQKTKQCNYCGVSVVLWRAKKVAEAGSAREALRVAQDFKMRQGERTK